MIRRRVSAPDPRRIIPRREIGGVDFLHDVWEWNDALNDQAIDIISDTWEWNDSTAHAVADAYVDIWEWDDSFDVAFDINATITDSWDWADSFLDSISHTYTDTWEWNDSMPETVLDTYADTWEWNDSVSASYAAAFAFADTWEWNDYFADKLSYFDGVVYSINAETTAISQYAGWDFDSFAEIGGVHYAVNTTDLYSIGGDNDAGSDIDCCARSGYIDFGTDRLKRLDDAIIKGGDFEGQTIAKTRARGGGSITEYWYLSSTDSADARQYVKFGRGVRSDYWQFEFCNRGGDYWEFNDAYINPVLLDRRRST